MTFRRKRAVAIKDAQREQMNPKVSAKGVGTFADQIIQLAREHNIPIKEDADLIALLSKLDLEQALPPELYPLIAELLGFAYHLNQTAEGAGAEEPAEERATEDSESPEEAEISIEAGEAEMDELPRPPGLNPPDNPEETEDA